MVAVAPRLPGASRIRGLATAACRSIAATAASAVKPHKAALANLRSMPLTVAGTGCVDYAAFHIAAHGWGWLVTGLSLVVLELVIADET